MERLCVCAFCLLRFLCLLIGPLIRYIAIAERSKWVHILKLLANPVSEVYLHDFSKQVLQITCSRFIPLLFMFTLTKTLQDIVISLVPLALTNKNTEGTFTWYSLHILLTETIQILKKRKKCYVTYMSNLPELCIV